MLCKVGSNARLASLLLVGVEKAGESGEGGKAEEEEEQALGGSKQALVCHWSQAPGPLRVTAAALSPWEVPWCSQETHIGPPPCGYWLCGQGSSTLASH